MYSACLRSFQRNDTDGKGCYLRGGDEKRVLLYLVNSSPIPDSVLVPEAGLAPEIGLFPEIGRLLADWSEPSPVASGVTGAGYNTPQKLDRILRCKIE